MIGNCHPTHPARRAEFPSLREDAEAVRARLSKIDSMVSSTLASKVERVKGWCESCSLKSECRKQGTWINEDGKRVFGEGIFGGLTQAERKAAGF